MFSRASNPTHVCLRCQRRLARRTQQWSSPKNQVLERQPSSRLQSTAAARIEDDDDHVESPPTAEPILPPEGSRSSERPFQQVKTWRPSQTAKLGMNALGKPSEIIMLAQRNREIPVVPNESEQEIKESLHDSITSEKQPLSWEQTKANISQAREELGQQRGELTVDQWVSLSNTLVKGFRAPQLRRYVNEGWSRTPAEIAALKLHLVNREHAARLIATKVWAYQLPAGASANLSKRSDETKDPQQKPIQFKVYVQKAIIPFLQLRLHDLRKEYGVDMKIKGHDFLIRGVKDKVSVARNAITVLVKSLVCTVLSGHLWLGRMKYSDWSNERMTALTAYLRLQHGVIVNGVKRDKKKQAVFQFKVWHTKDDTESLARVRQALRMAIVSAGRSIQESTLLLEPDVTQQPKLIIVPCHTASPLPWDGVNHHYRLYDASTGDKRGSSRQPTKRSTSAVMKAVQNALSGTPISATNESPPTDLYTEYSASFGQALFGAMSPESTAFRTAVLRGAHPTFSTGSALVPQLFSDPKFQRPANSLMSHDGKYRPQTLVRIKLSPNEVNSTGPTFEIYLRGSDPSAGLAQHLEIVRVSSIVDEKTHLVPRPNRAVDVKFTKQTKLDFELEASTDLSQKALLDGLKEYIRGVQSQPALFTTLQIPPSLHRSKPTKRADAKEGVDENAESVIIEDADASKSTQNVMEGAATEAHDGTAVEYVLASMETLDIDARLVPSTSISTSSDPPLTLEHITSQGGQLSSDNQELVLRQKHRHKHQQASGEKREQVSGDGDKDEFEFDVFFKKSVDVADRIDGLGRQLRHRLERMAARG
jgi:hypothetical protein